jgi:hypothetical protein
MMSDNEAAAEEGRIPVATPSADQNNEEAEKVPDKDLFLVTWKGKDDPEDPKNWTRRSKWAATFVSMPRPEICLTADQRRT